MDDVPAYTMISGKMFLFRRQKILKSTLIPDIPEEELSFSDRVNNMPTGLPVCRKLYANLSDHAFNTNFMRSELLKEFVQVFFFMKFNITPLSRRTELYERDVMLMNIIL